LHQFGDDGAPAATVDPHQFLGMELNGRAVPIAELVLWIGYLQWHFRVHGNVPPAEPVLKKFDNIVERDAVLAYDGHPVPVTGKMAAANPRLPGLPDNWRDLLDKHTDTIFVWDRSSYKTDPVTGREVPDGLKRITLQAYKNPRPAEWPEADFILGNPPFLGKGKLREDLGDGYAETLRSVYPDVPESADFVMYWWHKAAELARRRQNPPVRLHHHQQPAPDLRPARRAAPSVGQPATLPPFCHPGSPVGRSIWNRRQKGRRPYRNDGRYRWRARRRFAHSHRMNIRRTTALLRSRCLQPTAISKLT